MSSDIAAAVALIAAKLNIFNQNVDAGFLSAVLAFVVVSLHTSFNHDMRTFDKIFAAKLGSLFPRHQIEKVYSRLIVVRSFGNATINRNSHSRISLAVLCVAYFRIARQVA